MTSNKIIKKKLNGSLLLELMLSLSIFSFIFLIVYKSYIAANKGSVFIRNSTDLHTQRSQVYFHLSEDLFSILAPNNLIKAYNLSEEIVKKEKNKDKQENNKNDKEDKKNNKNKSLIKLYLNYAPKLIKKDKEISLKFITSRDLLTKEKRHLIEVTYSFIPTNSTYENKELYLLKRSEKILFDKENNNLNSYTMLSFVSSPEIKFVIPIFDKKENEEKIKNNKENNSNENNKENKENKKSNFAEWKKNPKFKTVEKFEIENETELIKNSIMPYEIIIEGDLISFDKSKKIPLNFYISLPISDYCMQLYCDFENEKKESNQNKKEKKVEDINLNNQQKLN